MKQKNIKMNYTQHKTINEINDEWLCECFTDNLCEYWLTQVFGEEESWFTRGFSTNYSERVL